MSGKKFGNALFYIIGTCIIISISTVVAINIFADSKFFEKDLFSQQNQEAAIDSAQKAKEVETLKYKREFVPEDQVPKKTQKPKETPSAITSVGPIKVEIINQCDIETASEKLKTTLEAKGFIVSVNKYTGAKTATTKILERNDKGTAFQLQKALQLGKIIKDYKADSQYDLTLVLGLDYNP